jgi:hypothetical protein
MWQGFSNARPSVDGDNCDRQCGGFLVFAHKVIDEDGRCFNVFKCGACNSTQEYPTRC